MPRSTHCSTCLSVRLQRQLAEMLFGPRGGLGVERAFDVVALIGNHFGNPHDQLGTFAPGRVDPAMVVVAVRVKKAEDTVYVRDAILKVAAQLRTTPVSAQRLADAKAAGKYGLIRSLDNTDEIAATLAEFVRYRRAYATINEYYRMVDTLAESLQELPVSTGSGLTDR